MDYFEKVLSNIRVKASIYYAGDICGTLDFSKDDKESHIHLIKEGVVKISEVDGKNVLIDKPSIIFLPRPYNHKLIVKDNTNATVICGTLKLGVNIQNPITTSLPDLLIVELSKIDGIENFIDLILRESILKKNGTSAIQNRLCEILIIKLLGYCSEHKLSSGGTLAGFSEVRIARALHAIHSNPEKLWTVESLAYEANLSRARFANLFHHVLGTTPLDYLTSWRMLLVQELLCQGLSLEQISSKVGYSNASALSRAFSKQLGTSPIQWLKSTTQDMQYD